ncbi:MAG TPA: phosphoribosyltransferase family protein, partial [Gemmatimonadota bacterium]
ERITYELEYGSDALEMHADALVPTDRVLLVDDVLATGGTARAAADLVRVLGAPVVGAAFLVELAFLEGRRKLADLEIHSVLRL